MDSSYTYLTLSSQASNSEPVSATSPDSDFACNFTEPLRFDTAVDVAVVSITLNIANQPDEDAADELDCYILSSIVKPETFVADERTALLRRIVVNQINQRQHFTFPDLRFVACSERTINRVRIQLATDSFTKTKTSTVQLHNIQEPNRTADVAARRNEVSITLAFRAQRQKVTDLVGIGGRTKY